MPRISGLTTLALLGAMAVGPAIAAPQFAGTNDAPGTGSDHTVDCTDMQYRFEPYCQQLNAGAAPSQSAVTRRTNLANCPAKDLVAIGTDRNGRQLYRCDRPELINRSPATTFAK